MGWVLGCVHMSVMYGLWSEVNDLSYLATQAT